MKLWDSLKINMNHQKKINMNHPAGVLLYMPSAAAPLWILLCVLILNKSPLLMYGGCIPHNLGKSLELKCFSHTLFLWFPDYRGNTLVVMVLLFWVCMFIISSSHFIFNLVSFLSLLLSCLCPGFQDYSAICLVSIFSFTEPPKLERCFI